MTGHVHEYPTRHGSVIISVQPTTEGVVVTRMHVRDEGCPLTRRAVVGNTDEAARVVESWAPERD